MNLREKWRTICEKGDTMAKKLRIRLCSEHRWRDLLGFPWEQPRTQCNNRDRCFRFKRCCSRSFIPYASCCSDFLVGILTKPKLQSPFLLLFFFLFFFSEKSILLENNFRTMQLRFNEKCNYTRYAVWRNEWKI